MADSPHELVEGPGAWVAGRDGSGHVELRLSGSGGQGIMLAGTIVAEAATALGRHVVQTQSYGPEARGGASKSEIIIADEPIDYPEVVAPDITLCLSQAAWEKYAAGTTPGGLLLYDSGLVEPGGAAETWLLLGVPFARAAADELGTAVVANIVAVGALAGVSAVLPAEAFEEAVRRRTPERFRELNVGAYRLGLQLAETPQGGGRGSPSPAGARTA